MGVDGMSHSDYKAGQDAAKAMHDAGAELHEIEADAHSQPIGDYKAGMLSQCSVLRHDEDEPPPIRDYADD